MSSRLSAIDEARFIVRWEEILTALGRRAKQGDNRWVRSGLTNEELAKNRGMSKRSYQYTKSIANLHPEVQDHLNETDFANSKMDMVALAKETDEVQLEVASPCTPANAQGSNVHYGLARCKVLSFDWDEEKARLREQVGKPFSVTCEMERGLITSVPTLQTRESRRGMPGQQEDLGNHRVSQLFTAP